MTELTDSEESVESEGTVQSREIRAKMMLDRRGSEQSKVKFVC
jgi:hypothetical protein